MEFDIVTHQGYWNRKGLSGIESGFDRVFKTEGAMGEKRDLKNT